MSAGLPSKHSEKAAGGWRTRRMLTAEEMELGWFVTESGYRVECNNGALYQEWTEGAVRATCPYHGFGEQE